MLLASLNTYLLLPVLLNTFWADPLCWLDIFTFYFEAGYVKSVVTLVTEDHIRTIIGGVAYFT